ncbi:YdaS family helix-turn-helix protein [Pseudomonas aeruginosa]|uniref:transcriptional regulator n=3 Tax=Pseudomonas aeruginosa TaxID=287 RepID=UPI0018F87E27|nr:helix-turn-helix domain-containing protein [Pseudomonas aeruginosa]EIU2884823.1 helix-turn-helix domain-containing protein [Pseudomonas aeruginosa]EIU3158369.1 helix-turn-helix domain-containing protein [Pseudomonas aeruginosa]EIU3851338.1 helix-turn-helix domain-containing protein [Pseudomonas aeruginosa]EIU4339231.1 helix-turn-helix domain-containing protein [Pseudomonas aeruginosa]
MCISECEENGAFMDQSALEKAISAAGGGRALAQAMGLSPMAVSQWKKRGVPAERVPAVVRACKGAVAAHELRPDLPDLFPFPDKHSRKAA